MRNNEAKKLSMRNFALKRSFSIMAAVGLLLLTAGVALAWTKPLVTANCATDETSYSYNVNLSGTEPNYKFDWSYYSDFSDQTTVDGQKGLNSLFTLRYDGLTTLYVRWTSDHSSKSSVEANGTLCNPPTQPPVTAPPATEPPATEPPATEPPATEPPATEPPATEPPATPEITVPPTSTITPPDSSTGSNVESTALILAGLFFIGSGGLLFARNRKAR